MASARANPTLIGAFVVGAFALAATSVIVFGSGEMFERRRHLVTYFPAAVTGLDVGAPVVFHGVSIGEVKSIDALVEPGTFLILVRVRFDVVEGDVGTIGERRLRGRAALVKFVEQGLRAQLKSQSMITGKLYLDLALHPDSEIVLYNFEPDLIEIPSVPTSLQMLERQLRDLVARVRELPIEKMVEDLASTVAGLNDLVNDPETAEVISRASETLARAESLLGRLDARTDGLVDEVEEAVEEIRRAATAAEQTLAAVESTVEPGSALNYELTQTLVELQETLRSLRALADGMSEQPEQVIFGKSKGDPE